MNRMTLVKLVLLLIGLFIFASGVRTQRPEVRWAGIAIVAVAFFMRMIPGRRPPEDGRGSPTP